MAHLHLCEAADCTEAVACCCLTWGERNEDGGVDVVSQPADNQPVLCEECCDAGLVRCDWCGAYRSETETVLVRGRERFCLARCAAAASPLSAMVVTAAQAWRLLGGV